MSKNISYLSSKAGIKNNLFVAQQKLAAKDNVFEAKKALAEKSLIGVAALESPGA